MKIVSQVSTREEARELETIVQLFVVTRRIKELAYQSKTKEHLVEKTEIIPILTSPELYPESFLFRESSNNRSSR